MVNVWCVPACTNPVAVRLQYKLGLGERQRQQWLYICVTFIILQIYKVEPVILGSAGTETQGHNDREKYELHDSWSCVADWRVNIGSS